MTGIGAMDHPKPAAALLSATLSIAARSAAPVKVPAREGPEAESLLPEQVGLHRIVVVGGGAGGLELATQLGNKLGRRK